jgi:hypothetical protein
MSKDEVREKKPITQKDLKKMIVKIKNNNQRANKNFQLES